MSEINLSGFIDISGYEGLYAVNRKGEVRSIRKNIILKQWYTLGYLYVSLGKSNKERVNRLVAKTFIPNTENKPEVNHKNGIKADNNIDNLEWVTGSENKKHAYKNGLRESKNAVKAMAISRRKLSIQDAVEIKKLYKTGNYFYRQIGEMYNVSLDTIYHIIKNKTYREAM